MTNIIKLTGKLNDYLAVTDTVSMLNNATKRCNYLLLRDLLAFIFVPVIQTEIYTFFL